MHVCRQTFVAVTDGVEVDVVAVIVEEHERQPRVKRIDRNHEQNPNDPSLFTRTRVVTQVLVDL